MEETTKNVVPSFPTRHPFIITLALIVAIYEVYIHAKHLHTRIAIKKE